MKLDVKVEGLKELQARLKALPEKMQGKPMRSALQSGAKPIKETARSIHAWHDDTGFLRENIISYSVKKNEHEYTDQVRVGVRRRRVKRASKKAAAAQRRRQSRTGKKIVTPYYWRYLEFGTSRMPARPFMRPAFESQKTTALRRIQESLAIALDVAAKKLNK